MIDMMRRNEMGNVMCFIAGFVIGFVSAIAISAIICGKNDDWWN